MKILILGGTGMLGHRLWSSLSSTHEVWGTIRGKKEELCDIPNINRDNILEKIDIYDMDKLKDVVSSLKPDVVLNCIGIIKHVDEAKNHLTSVEINSLLPHRLEGICKNSGSRLVHFSTDCVFDGVKGNYQEDDISNATDLYGRSKFLGEVNYSKHVFTMRTSIIGREISPRGSLIDWFLSQNGREVEGYQKAIYTGFPTATIAKILNDYILPNDQLWGTYQVSSAPINKFNLLKLTKEAFGVDIALKENIEFTIDRSLNANKFEEAIGYKAPHWCELIKDLVIDNQFYMELRKKG